MWQGTIYAPLAKRVGVALCAAADLFLCYVACPYARVGEEEALLGCEAVDGFERFVGCGVLESVERNLQATMVGEVLTKRQTAVAVEVGQHLDV